MWEIIKNDRKIIKNEHFWEEKNDGRFVLRGLVRSGIHMRKKILAKSTALDV